MKDHGHSQPALAYRCTRGKIDPPMFRRAQPGRDRLRLLPLPTTRVPTSYACASPEVAVKPLVIGGVDRIAAPQISFRCARSAPSASWQGMIDGLTLCEEVDSSL